MLQHVLIRYRYGSSIALPQRPEYQVVRDRGRHPHPVRDCIRVFPGLCARIAALEGAHDRLAPIRLYAEETRTIAVRPTQRFQFLYRLPNPDDSSAPARGIDDGIRKRPAALLGDLITHALLPFGTIRLLQGRKVEHSQIGRQRAGLFSRVSDQSIH